MSKILDRLHQTGVAMKNNAIKDQLGDRLKKAAIEAMMAGIGSDEWKSYMSLFADNAQQLTRLTVRKDGEELWLSEARAYMVANSVCGADSTTQTFLRVDAVIDANLKSDGDNTIKDPPAAGEVFPAGVIVRPFRIPA